MLAVVVQCLSWSTENSHWVARVFWYWCILLDVFAIGISSQQLSILEYLQAGDEQFLQRKPLLGMLVREKDRQQYPDMKMIWVWECPMSLLVYSMTLFIVAVTVHVSYPLINDPAWEEDSKIATAYLIVLGINCLNIVYCSFWIYRRMPRYGDN
ncbi:hypothetical protein ASPWEDRAFT_35920 [Aspergillus wentii DTO 134E9]|uniref:Uncharacterized protein n=1 Tax=Aspergillus wentii DTO 134E9 TaxID=1073089 RepID=A0A1L9RTP8_ASPWE|nr:uncharacterized protein ASPWEDRAFT_35920 [Aspergillus wentii DTO 134E9]OJJ38295.1 hypothetical protein ASPWEDRAFT_35920 [Aspergillus wentii DTO 134E9]